MENMLDEMIAEARREAEKWQSRLEHLESRKGSRSTDIAQKALTLTNAIRRAIDERPRTATEVVDRVQNLLPGTPRNDIWAVIGQRTKAGEFAKTADLKLFIARPVRKRN